MNRQIFGNNAPALPLDDVQELFEANPGQKILPHPTDENFLVRTIEVSDLEMPRFMRPHKVLEHVKTHHQQLQDRGIHIPKHDHFMTQNSRTGTLYTAVERIENVPVAQNDKAPFTQLALSLRSYYKWTYETGQKYMLYDIAKDWQYMYGRPASAQADSSPNMYLIDVEPHLHKVVHELDTTVASELEMLAGWTGALATRSVDFIPDGVIGPESFSFPEDPNE